MDTIISLSQGHNSKIFKSTRSIQFYRRDNLGTQQYRENFKNIMIIFISPLHFLIHLLESPYLRFPIFLIGHMRGGFSRYNGPGLGEPRMDL